MSNRRVLSTLSLAIVLLIGDLYHQPYGACQADEPYERSIAPAVVSRRIAPVRASVRRRRTSRSWEIRGQRYGVVATSSSEDAEWTWQQLESAWTDMDQLAGNWGRVHYKPTVASGHIIVFVGKQSLTRHPRSHPPGGISVDNGIVSVHISPTNPTLRQQKARLRHATARAFLRVSDLDLMLPAWVQDGLVEYLAQPRPFQTAADAQRYQDTDLLTNVTLQDGEGPLRFPASGQHESSLWVRYLIQGDDGAHAHRFFDAMADTLAQDDNESRFEHRRRRDESFRSAMDAGPLRELVEHRSFQRGYQQWLLDPLVGQPRFEPAEGLHPELEQRQREMLLILKLASRMPAAGAPRRLGVVKFGPRPVEVEASPSEKLPSWNVPALYRSLTRRDGRRWSILDIDGRVLRLADSARIDSLFAVGQRRYSTEIRDGKTVLISKWRNGATIEAWLEEDSDNPRRPRAHIDVKRT